MLATSEGGFDADVVALDTFSPAALAAAGPLQGRIALLPEGDPPGDPATAARTRHAFAAALRAAGVVAMLSPDNDAENQLSARGFGFCTVIGLLPAAQIGRDDAQLIRERLTRGPVRISLELINRLTPAAATVVNVIADMPGRDRPDELGVAAFDDSLRYAFQSDGAPFILAGIPTLDLNADDTK